MNKCRCQQLSLVSLAYLWQKEQRDILQMIAAFGIRAVLVKVAAMGICDALSFIF